MPSFPQFFANYGYVAVPLAEIEHFKNGGFVGCNGILSDSPNFDTPLFEHGGGGGCDLDTPHG